MGLDHLKHEKALPPHSRAATPDAEASQWVEATTPKVP
jgi:hypothetical protein